MMPASGYKVVLVNQRGKPSLIFIVFLYTKFGPNLLSEKVLFSTCFFWAIRKEEKIDISQDLMLCIKTDFAYTSQSNALRSVNVNKRFFLLLRFAAELPMNKIITYLNRHK